MQTTRQIIYQTLADLVLTLQNKIPGAADKAGDSIDDAFKGKNYKIPVRFDVDDPPEAPRPEGYATGGVVKYLARGGFGDRWRPRGTDTVPAMLTPGEGVLNVAAMNRLGTSALEALNSGRMSSISTDTSDRSTD